MDYLIDPSFQEVYRRFVLSFEGNAFITGNTGYLFSIVEIKGDWCKKPFLINPSEMT